MTHTHYSDDRIPPEEYCSFHGVKRDIRENAKTPLAGVGITSQSDPRIVEACRVAEPQGEALRQPGRKRWYTIEGRKLFVLVEA
jgi:hypothetical protein